MYDNNKKDRHSRKKKRKVRERKTEGDRYRMSEKILYYVLFLAPEKPITSL